MKRFSTGGTYINFLTEDDGAERPEAALGGALQRVAQIETRWDPHNAFRANRNIKPVLRENSARNRGVATLPRSPRSRCEPSRHPPKIDDIANG